MTQPNRKRDWTAHDASIPFRDDRLAKLNGTNPARRRPRSIDATREAAANDNAAPEVSGATPSPYTGPNRPSGGG